MIKKILPLILLTSLVIASCGDDEQTANLGVSTEITFGNQPLDLNATYSVGDFDVKIDVAQFYVGGFELVNGDNAIDSKDRYILADEDGETAAVFSDIDVEQGIDAIRFHVGVAPEINGQTEAEFLARSVEDPLSIKDPAMHWNWMSGYRFIRVDGRIDDNKDGTITADETTVIAYHIGTDALLAALEITTDLDGLNEGANTLILRMDIQALLNGVDLTIESDRDTHTMNNIELARLIQSNLAQGGIGFRLN